MSNLVKETFGVHSTRPELACPSSSVLQQLEDREWKVSLKKNLEIASRAVYLEGKCSESLAAADFTSPETPFLFQLEKTMLDLSSPSLTDGEFYCSFFKLDDVYYCRFFESGVLQGYFLSEGMSQLKNYFEEHRLDMTKLVWLQVSTQDDIKQYHRRYTLKLERKRSHHSLSNPGSDTGRRYVNLLERNKTSILNSHRKLMAKAQTSTESCQLLGTVVNVIKHNSHKENNTQKARFLEASGVFHPILHIWENTIHNYRSKGVPLENPEFKFIFDPPSSSKYTLYDQCKIISCLPNDHYWNEGTHAHVGYGRMLSIRDSTEKYKPASLRNLILYHHRESNYSAIFRLVDKFRNPESSPANSRQNINDDNINIGENMQNSTPRQVRPKRKALNEEDILRNLRTVNPLFTTHNRASDNSLYEKYKTAQTETGGLFWRVHESDIDVLCLNDVNMTTGCLMESSFVHMTRRNVGNVNVYHCTCTLFATLLQLATLDEQPDTEIDSINIKCCHIRYFKEIIEPDYPIYFSTEVFTSPTKSQKSIMLSLAALQKPVILLLSSLRTKKFSVVPNSSEDCKFVNVSRNRVSCQSGECSAIYSFSTRKVIYLCETSNVCPHLQAMKDHKNLWMNGNDIEEDIEDEDEEAFIDNEEDENDLEDTFQPETTQTKRTNFFNPATGLWDFPSLSEHRPKEEDDPVLQRAIKKRLAVFDGAEGVVRDTKGYLTGNNPLVLFPPVLEDGCLCGAGYSDDDHPNGALTEVKYRTVVYLTNGPARFEVLGRNCLAANAECQVQYGGSSDSLHFLSKETAAGDEIGWDFVDHALNTHVTFSAYCKIMSKKYRRNFLNSAKFMSPQTFIAWWFSWSSKFKTDFRKPCSICKYNPKFLACDGTKIGISFKNADTDPIEKPTSTEKIDPCHRRNDRCFLNFNSEEQPDAIIRKCRDHLAYTSKKALGQLNQTLEFEEELIRNTLLIETVSGQCSNIMRKFVCNEYHESVQKKLAVIFKFLSTNHSLSSLIPFRYTDLLDSILLELRTSTQNHRINLISDFSNI